MKNKNVNDTKPPNPPREQSRRPILFIRRNLNKSVFNVIIVSLIIILRPDARALTPNEQLNQI